MEIATAVGEALLSAYIIPLIERLTSDDELNIFARREKIDADIKDWERTLAEINDLLHDAENTQKKSLAVKNWLVEFRDLTYDIEDVLDEFNTEALKRKMMEDSHTITNKLRKFISTHLTSFWFKNKIISRIKHITRRLKDINERQSRTLKLRRIVNVTTSHQQKERDQTSSLVDEMEIYCRDDEKEAIVQMLLRDEGGNNPISVILILGMGGIGKTTLAQLVYNDTRVENHFDNSIWVYVSENFDVTILTRRILHCVAPETRDLQHLDLNSLQETLKEKLSQKKCLLILDDIWEEDYRKWDLLRRPLVTMAPGSKIVVTARKMNVAPNRSGVSTFHVKKLPDNDCLSLLAHHALAAQSFDARSDLKKIGQELVERCDGLPLAVEVLGGLLRNKQSREEWEHVLKSKWWNESGNNVQSTLKLSYNDLPSHLKRCFIYCAIFPKDYEFDRDELVKLWMAEGFLHHPDGEKLMEYLGIENFKVLLSRSFFNISRRSGKFVMHDLMRDLALTIAEDICYNYENKTGGVSKYEKVRHASCSCLEEYEVFTRMKKLRTIFFSALWGRRGASFLDCKKYESLPQSKCVRVLSLTDLPLRKLSNSIGDLKHLRYINLSYTQIRKLPKSVSTLFNLETLLLCYCVELVKLPNKIGNLVNLRHLDISETEKLQKLPCGIGMLTSLQTISKFIVKEGDGATIAELKNLNNLRGSLSIQGLENVQDAELANLKGKRGLEELELEWTGHGTNDMSVLESLEPPHQNLKRLSIIGYGGAEFPYWMNNMRLVFLDLWDCEETQVLPPLGQLPSLKELSIYGLKAVKSIGVEFYGNVVVPFPLLESLGIGLMSEWIEWSHGNMDGEAFPHLQMLYIYQCPKWRGNLPNGFHTLKHLSELHITGCPNLVSFAPKGLPCTLKSIKVEGCNALDHFPIIDTGDGRESLLEDLDIVGCSSLNHFERNFKLPISLRRLTIQDCENLLSLPDGLMVQEDDNTNRSQSRSQSHLEYLKIKGCQGLTSLPTGKFPAALKTLEIWGCSLQLETAFSDKNTALETIYIGENDSMKALPSIDCLQSLRHLSISGCPALESSSEMGFLSTSLQTLEIKECQNLRQPIAEWRLGMLSSLETLVVCGRCPATEDVVSFPDDDCSWLPTSLKHLDMKDFINLESVSMGLQMLTSLESLTIARCPKLQSLPKEALPFSLKQMSHWSSAPQ